MNYLQTYQDKNMGANSKDMMKKYLFYSIRLNHNNHTSQAFQKF